MKFLYMQQIDSKKTQRGEKNCLKLTCSHGSKGDSYSIFHIHDESTNCEYHMFDYIYLLVRQIYFGPQNATMLNWRVSGHMSMH